MNTIIECPNCTKRYTIHPERVGKPVKCGQCNKEFLAKRHTENPPQTEPEMENDSPSISINVPRETRSRKTDITSFAEFFLGLFDWRFRRYLTPWIVRVTWIVFLLMTAMWLLILLIGFIVSITPVDSTSIRPKPVNNPFQQFKQPETSTGGTLQYVAMLISVAITTLLGVLWVRVILELVIVRFNMAHSLETIEKKSL